jgi:proton-dependent oligopeptide transporter, POT family
MSIPSSIRYIIGNEAAERFCYYGLRTILTVYLVTHFFNPTGNPALQAGAEARANEATHFFITLNYLLPVAGALLADWFLGKYKLILWLSVVYCVGNFMMAGFTDNYPVFMTGLVLIAIGSGGIKPCVSANVGDQFDASNAHLIPKAFSWFYLSINFGSVFSTLLSPYLLKAFGARVAFGVPGGLMLLATVIFFAGRKKYKSVPPAGFPRENFIGISWYALRNAKRKKAGDNWLEVAHEKYSATSVDAIRSVWKVLSLFAFIPVYWMLSDQSTSEWVIQATKLDLNIGGLKMLPQQVQAANPILILLFTPLLSAVVYPRIGRAGLLITAQGKMLAGFVLLMLAFVIIYYIQLRLDAGQTPSVIWQLLAYALQTLAEVMVYLTGLEYAYQQAPPSMKSTIMSFWLLTVSTGNYFVSLINSNIAAKGIMSKLTGAGYYGFFIILMLVMSICFAWCYRNQLFKRQTPAPAI